MPNEIEIEIQGTAMPNKIMEKASATYLSDDMEAFRSSNLVGDNYNDADPEGDDDDVLALRDSLEEVDDRCPDNINRQHKEAREETTPSPENPTTSERERQSAIDDISLTGDTAPTSAKLIKQAMQPVGSAPNNALTAKSSTKTMIPVPIQNLNALARNHLGDCGGVPMGLVADDELVENMRVGVGIAGNVAGRAAKNAPGGKEVIHGVTAGIAYAEETAQSAKKLISDTKQLARDMDIKKFAASSASWSFEDDMFRLSDESGQSDDLSGSRSKSSNTKESFRYTESDESSYYSKDDDFDMETMQSSFVTENPSGIYTESIAPSAVEDLSFAPQSVMSTRCRRTRNKPPKAPKRVVSNKIPPSKARYHGPDHVDKDKIVLSETADVNNCGDEDENSEFTEVTYQSETNVYVDLQSHGIQEKDTVPGDDNVDKSDDSSEYTEVTVCDDVDNNAGICCIDKATNDRADRANSDPNPPLATTIAHTKSPEQILRDNTVDVVPVKVKWIDPPPEQAALIAAMLSTSIGRRSNACGTIKMMASNKKKAAQLARTRILVDALILAINDGSEVGEEKEIHLEAQTRATMAISHLSEVKENRVLLAQHPALIRALIEVIRKDKGEARVAACRSLVMMSKMQQNKMPLVKTDGLISLLADIMSGRYDQRDKSNKNDGVSPSFSSMDTNSNGGSKSRSRGNSSRDGSVREANSSSSRASMAIHQCKDARYQEFLSLSRINCCAAFSHLAKDCASSAILCKDKDFLDAIISLCSNSRSPMYKRCLEILAHLTRFSGNDEMLASNSDVTKVLLTSGKANGLDERLYALRSFQNISAVCGESRIILATDTILSLLVSASFQSTKEEQEIALRTIFNLALESGTLVNLTNTKNFTAVLINVINSADSSPTSCQIARKILRLVAKWMNTLADIDNAEHQNSVLKPTGWMLYS